MQNSVLQLDPRDNVLVALTALRKGEQIPFSGNSYTLLSDIPAKQKFVTRDIGAGDQIIMYGGLVGTATEPIRQGDLLSTRNIRHAASDFHSGSPAPRWTPPMFRHGGSERFSAITGAMARWARETTGW